jgi:formamidopyrimidine-DNA glycosylase
MPELPDIELYLAALRPRVVGKAVRRVRVISPFVMRTFEPPVESIEGLTIDRVGRMGKRIVFHFPNKMMLVVHLMIAGRFRWSEKRDVKPQRKLTLAALEFDQGTLMLVEPSQKKRAGIWLLRGEAASAAMFPSGLDVLRCTPDEFASRLRSENHTLKRSLTDPRLFDGIGNAYSDEILHAARLSPVKLTDRLTDHEVARLFDATRSLLSFWTQRLQNQFAEKFPGPGDVTAFRPEFAVHGKYGKPCPACGTTVQRIRYAENETNYCPRCQTDGKLLADRSLSRLLKDDWPSSIEEWEERRAPRESRPSSRL